MSMRVGRAVHGEEHPRRFSVEFYVLVVDVEVVDSAVGWATEGLGGEMPFDCFIGEGKVVFYRAGSFTPFIYDLDINNDGTLQTPVGAIKKMGN
jgi:hypothetical protein